MSLNLESAVNYRSQLLFPTSATTLCRSLLSAGCLRSKIGKHDTRFLQMEFLEKNSYCTTNENQMFVRERMLL